MAGNIQKAGGSVPARELAQTARSNESNPASGSDSSAATGRSRPASQTPGGRSPRSQQGTAASQAVAARTRTSSQALRLLQQRRTESARALEGAPHLALDMHGGGRPVAEADEQGAAQQPQPEDQSPGRRMHTAVAAFNAAGGAPSQEVQEQGFAAALAYSTAHGGKTEVAGAIAAQALTTGFVAGTTFGVGRTAGMPSTYAPASGDGAPPVGEAFKQQAANAGGSTAAGVVGALASQGALPTLVSLAPKMAKVPVKMLVPDSGNPAADAALRSAITKTQNRLASLGSIQNAPLGGLAFGAAMLVRAGAEFSRGALPGPAGFGSAVPVSLLAGATWGAAMAANMARAKVQVPNPAGGEDISLNAFYAQPASAKLAMPTWMPEGNKPPLEQLQQAAMSIGGRIGALGAAGAILQFSEVANQHAPDGVKVPLKAVELAAAAAVYFAMLGAIGKQEAQRRSPRPVMAANPVAEHVGAGPA